MSLTATVVDEDCSDGEECLCGDFPFLEEDFGLVLFAFLGVIASAEIPSLAGVELLPDLLLEMLWDRSLVVLPDDDEATLAERILFFRADDTCAFVLPALRVWEDILEAHDVECAILLMGVFRVVLVPTVFVTIELVTTDMGAAAVPSLPWLLGSCKDKSGMMISSPSFDSLVEGAFST